MYSSERVFVKDGVYLEFAYTGTAQNENVNYEKLENLIDNVFEYKSYDQNIEKILLSIRSIFKDFKEQFLKINLVNDEYSCLVLASNGKIQQYNKISKVFNNRVQFCYDDISGVSFSTSNNSTGLLEYQSVQSINNFIITEIERIKIIDTMVPKKALDMQEKSICLIYKTIYGSLPDFSKKDNWTKFTNILFQLKNHKFKINSIKDSYIDNMLSVIDRIAPIGEINQCDLNSHVPLLYESEKEKAKILIKK